MIAGYLSSAAFISWNGRPDFSRSVLRTGSLLSPDCEKSRQSILVEFRVARVSAGWSRTDNCSRVDHTMEVTGSSWIRASPPRRV